MASISCVKRVFICCLAVLPIIIAVLLPIQSQAVVITKERNIESDVLGMLLEGDKPEKSENARRKEILDEINDTATSIEDLEYLLHVVRAQNSNSRERRQRSQQGYRCSFYVSEPTIVRGYCYYDFGNIVTCKSGNKLSFEAAECPRSRPGT
ncbi:uncharacterized protein [Apostichopus japonicus]|uniref:uncharacterized protein n=1 Tax=Stichopus japonicus TaxID=307972 RepID=UPI003AB74A6C